MNLRLVVPALCFGLAFYCGMQATQASPRDRRTGGGAAALGGFGALATQALWIRADRALQAHREDEALVYLRAINDISPHVVSAARYTAFEIGANLAEGRADVAVRWALVHEGLRALDVAVRENPGEAQAFANRGGYLMIRIVQTPDLAAAYRRDVHARGAAHAARADFADAVRLDPDDPQTRIQLAKACKADARDAVAEDRWQAAAESLAGAVAALDGLIALLESQNDAPSRPFAQEIDGARAARASADEMRAEAAARASRPR